jgi:hypothetical protein
VRRRLCCVSREERETEGQRREDEQIKERNKQIVSASCCTVDGSRCGAHWGPGCWRRADRQRGRRQSHDLGIERLPPYGLG